MFTRDNRTETFLKQMGVTFRFKNRLLFSELVEEWQQVNLGRPVPIRDEAVLEYAALLDQGSEPPAVILASVESGYEVLDGVQRLSAAQLQGQRDFSAYVVEASEKEILVIRVLANARLQGRQEPAEWTRRRAVEVLVVEGGMSPEAVAKMTGSSKSSIESLARIIECGNGIAAIGGPELPDVIVEAVAKQAPNEKLLEIAKPAAGFLNTLKLGKFTGADAQPLIDEFFSPVSCRNKHDVYVSRLEEIRNRPEVQMRITGRRGGKVPSDIILQRSLKAAITTLDEIASSGEKLQYIDEFFRLCARITEKLHDLDTSKKKPAKCRVPADMYKEKQQ